MITKLCNKEKKCSNGRCTKSECPRFDANCCIEKTDKFSTSFSHVIFLPTDQPAQQLFYDNIQIYTQFAVNNLCLVVYPIILLYPRN